MHPQKHKIEAKYSRRGLFAYVFSQFRADRCPPHVTASHFQVDYMVHCRLAAYPQLPQLCRSLQAAVGSLDVAADFVAFSEDPRLLLLSPGRNAWPRHRPASVPAAHTKHPRPTVQQKLAGFGTQDAVKRVKQLSLSRIYNCSHNYFKSLMYNRLNYKSQTLLVNTKIHINILFTKLYNIFSVKNTFDAGILF